jgi:uncharacterized protein
LDELFERVIADFQARALPSLTPREVRLPSLPGKVDAVAGMRRSGKTYLLYQRLRELEQKGVDRERTLYVNFEDERLLPLKAERLQLFPEALYRRTPLVRNELCFFFFDEVQNVPGWERFVRRLLDSERAQIVVTGSSSALLGREIATSLRGRSLTTEVLPFSFRESLIHADIEIPAKWPPPSALRTRLEKAFDDYLDVGGFPEVQTLPRDLRVRTLQEYVDVAVFRDVIERHRVSNAAALRQVVRQLTNRPSGSFSVNRVYHSLKSQGFKIAKDAVHAFVNHLEEAFLLFTMDVDSESPRVRQTRPRKCYVIDTGLARSLSYRAAGETGWLLENAVFLELRRRGYSTGYVVTVSGREVDFIARRPGEDDLLIQVALHLDDPETREREIAALREALSEGRAKRALIITLREAGTARIGNRRVRIEPAWSWFARH